MLRKLVVLSSNKYRAVGLLTGLLLNDEGTWSEIFQIEIHSTFVQYAMHEGHLL